MRIFHKANFLMHLPSSHGQISLIELIAMKLVCGNVHDTINRSSSYNWLSHQHVKRYFDGWSSGWIEEKLKENEGNVNLSMAHNRQTLFIVMVFNALLMISKIDINVSMSSREGKRLEKQKLIREHVFLFSIFIYFIFFCFVYLLANKRISFSNSILIFH